MISVDAGCGAAKNIGAADGPRSAARVASVAEVVAVLEGLSRRPRTLRLSYFFKNIWKESPMSDEEMKAELDRLRNENAALKKGAATGISMKVSEKGGLSVYGMGRFPITLYKEQWLKLLDMSDAIRSFIAANDAALKTKG